MTDRKKPVYLLAGGRPRNRKTLAPLLQAAFRESGVASPRIAYSGTANGDDRRFFGFIAASFREAGAGRVDHALIAPERADLKKARAIMEKADIVFISGGDVDGGMKVLREKGMIDFLVDLYERGKPFFGISAGSIMLAREWVRWTDPDDESSAEIFPCLGIAPVLCDTHAEADDWQELKALLSLEKDNAQGCGIPSGAAIKVFPDGRVEALGSSVPQYIQRHGRVKRIEDILPR
jgi:peptidase E